MEHKDKGIFLILEMDYTMALALGCSETPKLVSVSQHLRQPANLSNPVFIYGTQGRQIVTCMRYALEIIKRGVFCANAYRFNFKITMVQRLIILECRVFFF